ncbi:MAG: hypothetical protein J1G30_00845 [Spirochaetales bacterium]|nr:hypothetical protein [Spirochaetales bacterium]
MSKKIIDHRNVFDYHKKSSKQKYNKNKRVSFVSGKDSYNSDNTKVLKNNNSENSEAKNKLHSKKKNEQFYCGVHTCHTVFKQRKNDIIKVYLVKELVKEFGELLKFCSTKKIAYRIIDDEDLKKLTDSTHHEGIAILTKTVKTKTIADLPTNAPILWLDGVVNPHNIGIMMRVMAHFGWKHLVVNGEKTVISPATARMSEGGCEFVNLYGIESAKKFILWARKNGYKIVGTSSHSSLSVYEYSMCKKIILVFGQEADGISKDVMQRLDESLIIPGTDNVESLNVSVAGGIFLSEYTRQMEMK